MKAVAAEGEKGAMQLGMATHAGMSVEQFQQIVSDWLASATDPKFHKSYNECIYQPMVELLAYLRANGFKTYIVSGGGIEFIRPWAFKAYGIPPEQIIGSSIKTKFQVTDGKPELMRLPEIAFIDDGPGKPVGTGISTSDDVPLLRSATPMVTNRCLNGLRLAQARDSCFSFITQTVNESMRMTGSLRWVD